MSATSNKDEDFVENNTVSRIIFLLVFLPPPPPPPLPPITHQKTLSCLGNILVSRLRVSKHNKRDVIDTLEATKFH